MTDSLRTEPLRRLQRHRHRRALLLAAALAIACAGCGRRDGSPAAAGSAAVAGTGLTGIRYLSDAGDGTGYERAIEPREFRFPDDHGSHSGFRTEWWYFTGNLTEGVARHYGFELTVFRIALTAAARERESAFAANEIWMAHLAVTDTARRQFQAVERLSRGAPGLAGVRRDAATGDVTVFIEDWQATLAGDRASLSAGDAEFGIELEMSGLERIVAQGVDGLDAKGPESGNASFYFSAPRLAVSGTLRSAGEAPVRVTGTAWMDREWSTSALSSDIAGWDWFALQLDDGSDVMFYRLRGRDGSTSPFSGGSITAAGGGSIRLEPTSAELESTETWTSPATGVRYPVAWRMRIPAAGLDIAIEPWIGNQELDLTVRYWEGAVSIRGTRNGEPIGGVGYLELAGY